MRKGKTNDTTSVILDSSVSGMAAGGALVVLELITASRLPRAIFALLEVDVPQIS